MMASVVGIIALFVLFVLILLSLKIVPQKQVKIIERLGRFYKRANA